MYISVIIPVFDDFRLESALNSLYYQSYPFSNYEILVIDDYSEKIDIKRICDRYPNVKYFKLAKNSGSYACRNLGIQEAKGDILAFTDADCILDNNWIKNGVDLISSSEFSLVGGMIQMIGDDFKIDEYLDACLYGKQEFWVKYRNFGATANLFVKKEVIADVGLFNDKLRSQGDSEFCNRAFLKGWKIGYCGSAIAYHPARNWQEILIKNRRCHCKTGIFKVNNPNINYYTTNIIDSVRAFNGIINDENLPNLSSKFKFMSMFYYVQLLKLIYALEFNFLKLIKLE